MKRRKIHYFINFIALLEDWFDKDVNIKKSQSKKVKQPKDARQAQRSQQ